MSWMWWICINSPNWHRASRSSQLRRSSRNYRSHCVASSAICQRVTACWWGWICKRRPDYDLRFAPQRTQMPKKTALPTQKRLLDENADLRARLDEAEDTLRAIRAGEVDALVVSSVDGEQIFTLKGAELPYRVLIEDMN